VRVAPVMMDLLVVLELLESRETVESLVHQDPWDWLVPLVLPDPLVPLVALETVERLVPKEALEPSDPLEPEVPPDLLEPVVRREALARREREA